MSTSPESGSPELGLDLDLHFLPAWAQKPAENKYAKFEGPRESSYDRGRGDRRDRRPDRPPPRRDVGQAPRGNRSGPGPGREPGRFRGPDRGPRPERFEPAPPPIDLNVSFIPEERGVESLARQIRLTGRAYPLFDIAFLVLKKPDRYVIRFNTIKKADGQVAQPLFICALDDTLWLSEQEAVDYVLGKHFATFYQAERTPTDPPKGTYTFVAQCGMSGAVLGPPNYHDYQNKLRKLHAERFSRVPFEVFKARIKIVRDEAIVKKWLDDQSWKTEFVCLNVPESLKLGTREEVEQHFRQTHLANVIKPVDSHSLNGTAAQALPTPAMQRLVRRSWDEQMRFPLRLVNVLSQQFAGHGLQFFKVNKTVTHVAVARPRFLDLVLTPVSEGVRRIVDFVEATPNCTRRKILEALAPVSVPATPPPPPAPGAAPAEPVMPPEVAAVISDLHWLIHQGHVIEFAKGLIELAKRPPPPRPPRPGAPKAAGTPAEGEAEHPTAAEVSTADHVSSEAESEAASSAPSGEVASTAGSDVPQAVATAESAEMPATVPTASVAAAAAPETTPSETLVSAEKAPPAA